MEPELTSRGLEMARGFLSLGARTCGDDKRPFPLPWLEKQVLS